MILGKVDLYKKVLFLTKLFGAKCWTDIFFKWPLWGEGGKTNYKNCKKAIWKKLEFG